MKPLKPYDGNHFTCKTSLLYINLLTVYWTFTLTFKTVVCVPDPYYFELGSGMSMTNLTAINKNIHRHNTHRCSDLHSGETKHSNRSCYANLQLSRTIKRIVNLNSMTCCLASPLDLHLPKVKTNWGKQRFVFSAITYWNKLSLNIRNSLSLNSKLKTLFWWTLWHPFF